MVSTYIQNVEKTKDQERNKTCMLSIDLRLPAGEEAAEGLKQERVEQNRLWWWSVVGELWDYTGGENIKHWTKM